MRGRLSTSLWSTTTLVESPVRSSTFSSMVTPSRMSPNFTTPPTSVRMGIVRIPFGDHFARLHLGPVALLELGPVDDGIAFALALPLPVALRVVDDRDLAVAVHHDEVAVLALDRHHVDQLEEAFVARFQRRLLGAAARRAADVER